MANTPFLDLVKPAGTDRALVSVINSNSDKIDGGVSTLSEQIAHVAIANEYTTVLAAINAYRTTKKLPFTIQKRGDGAYTDLPSGVNNVCEWCAICYGSDQRVTVQLTIFTSGSSNNGKTFTANIYNGAYIFNWEQLVTKSELEPTAYTAPTMSTGVSLGFGGYKKIGKIVIVNIRMYVSTSTTSFCYGLPAPLSNSSITEQQALCSFGTNVSATNSIYLNKNGTILAENAESNRIIIVSGVYICA